MAGREFGPPPSVIAEFNHVWRDWLNLVFQKIYKRTFTLALSIFNSVGHSSVPMAAGNIGVAAVMLADDTTSEYQYLSFLIPLDWVPGTDLTIHVHFLNSTIQTGVKTVITQIVYNVKAPGELVLTSSTTLTDTFSLPSDVAAGTYHQSGTFTIIESALALGDTVFLRINRDATTDTCVGDVGYQNILIEYQGFINHE